MKNIYYFLVIILCAGVISACSKKKVNPVVSANDPGTALDRIKDSVYLYANEDYLWNTALPSYSVFNPRSFTNPEDKTALSNELDKLSQYAINPATNLPYEYYSRSPGRAKYSFIDDGTVAAALNGVKGDFGFEYQYNGVNDIRVVYVYPGSPAGLAGIQRGYQITSINNSTNVSYDGVSNGKTYGTGTSANINFVYNAIFNSNTLTMTLQKQNGTAFNVSLNTANYNVNPVLKDTVFNVGGGHVVGYIVFNSFTSDANADPLLNAAFTKFAAQGVTDLCVDLRYNGGGYVSTAEHLDNLIVPSAKSGTPMYTTYYNSNLQNDNYPLLSKQFSIPKGAFKPQNNQVGFNKSGSLNVSRVFFIISGGTASASELTINNLRPLMDVQFVGQTSYGKPVGFFGISINKYTMYTPEFYTQNAANQGGYYSGFTPGTTGYPGVNDYDDYTKNFGDPTEGLLAHVLNYVKTGTYAVQTKTVQSLFGAKTFSLQEANSVSIDLASRKFNGMIENKLKSK